MTEQPITAELSAWVVDQLQCGQPPAVLLDAMRSSGWDADVAVAALAGASGQRELLRSDRSEAASGRSRVPEPWQDDCPTTLWAHDREVRVLVALRNPRIVVFGNVLADDECDELVQRARQRLSRSETVATLTGASEINPARSSDGMFFQRGEHPVCSRIEIRLAALLRWPAENAEGLQVLRYRSGAEYKPHFDYFDPAQPGTPAILQRGGQRVASLVCYLNTPARGGATVFPDARLDVAPVKGNAVFFSYDRPHPDTGTLHGGAPVQEGEKWVATQWLRQGRFE